MRLWWQCEKHLRVQLPSGLRRAQCRIPLTNAKVMLPLEEGTLAVLRWRQETKPEPYSWQPICERWIGLVGATVRGLGGDHDRIPVSLGRAIFKGADGWELQRSCCPPSGVSSWACGPRGVSSSGSSARRGGASQERGRERASLLIPPLRSCIRTE